MSSDSDAASISRAKTMVSKIRAGACCQLALNHGNANKRVSNAVYLVGNDHIAMHASASLDSTFVGLFCKFVS